MIGRQPGDMEPDQNVGSASSSPRPPARSSLNQANTDEQAKPPNAASGATNACDRESSASFMSDEQPVIRKRSESRDSVNDYPKSIDDSISATSGRLQWSSSVKDIGEYDPSVNSIKGDSVSATIADYNRKHNRTAANSDNHSRASCRLDPDPSAASKNDNSSININYYSVSSSSAAGPATSSKVGGSNHHNQNSNLQHSQTQRSRGDNHKYRRNHQKRDWRHSNSSSSRQSAAALEQALQAYEVPQGSVYQIEPVIIRGNGNLSLFGLSNSFNTEFPPALLGRVSPEEFERTMQQINSLLREQQSMSAKLLLIGSLFCCCSLGFSLVWPSIVLRRRSKCNLVKFLANENQRLYSKLGMSWRLGRRYTNRFVEHVLIIEFNPKIDPFMPD